MKNLVSSFQYLVGSKLLLFLTFLICQNLFSQGYKIPEKPKFQTSVYDYIQLLSTSEKSSLENKLIKYSDTTSTQIVVAIIPSTNGENISFLGTKWAHEWGVGQKKEDNGVFILLAKDDRKIAISTGYGVEHLLTDALSKRIISNDIIPYFKQDNYYGGLDRGAEAIFEVLTGEYQGSRKQTSQGFPFEMIIFMFIIFLLIVISISKSKRGGKGGSGSNSGGGFSILDAIILSNMGRGSYGGSSGGFGSSSGGGFSGGGFGGGFGGGGFGGGGASGGW